MKYSKQRDFILNYVQNSYNHPTADVVYLEMQKILPNISLGTVYRNLNVLCELGLIKKIITPDDKVSFDKIDNDHNHIYCKKCKKLFDVDYNYLNDIEVVINKNIRHSIDLSNSLLIGTCSKCLEERNEI